MLRNSDILIFFKEYPHTDIFESAYALASILGSCIAGEVKPAASVRDCEMIGFYFTDREPMRSFVAELRGAEQQPGVLSASLVHGFPWGDTPAMGTKMIVYTDGARELGDAVANHFGDRLVSLRGQTMPPLLQAEAAVDRARKAKRGPLILADVSDNPGGGAPGDSTFLIKALLDGAAATFAAGPLWDPGAVAQAKGLGVGGEAFMRVGGKASPFSGPPLDLRFRVAAICEQAAQHVDGWPWPMGDVVLLTSANLELVVCSKRSQCLHPDAFRCVGVEPAERAVLVVKSAQHFTATFASLAAEVAYVETPAALTFSSDAGRYRRLTRPKWPFDEPAGAKGKSDAPAMEGAVT
jgi:microcystin degradation protein MlrC